MAELADALDSGSSVSNDLEVQLLSSALPKRDGPRRFSRDEGRFNFNGEPVLTARLIPVGYGRRTGISPCEFFNSRSFVERLIKSATGIRSEGTDRP